MNVGCPFCSHDYELSEEYIGKTVTCSACGRDFVVENPNLMPCPDCFGKVSRRASVCPHCGAPLGGRREVVALRESCGGGEEKEILCCHPSAIYYFGELLIGFLLSLVIIGLPFFIITLININCTLYLVTNRRVLVKTGWLNKKQTEIWIKDMRGVNLKQTFWERLIGTGSISIGTAATAGAEIQMHGISDAQEVIDVINRLRLQ